MDNTNVRLPGRTRNGVWRGMLVGAIILCGLAAVEIVRIGLVEHPESYAIGLYPPETSSPDPDAPSFRWTTATAALASRPAGSILSLPLVAPRPDLAERPPTVRVSLGSTVLDVINVKESGWQINSYYIPPLTGSVSEPQLAAVSGASTGQRRLGPWRELHPWSGQLDPPLWLRFEVEPTFVPAESADSTDHRTLGIGLGEIAWSDEVPPSGFGFHEWEGDGEQRFRWTRRLWASQPVEVAGNEAHFGLRADHPDIGDRPVQIDIYWNDRVVHTAQLRDRAWLPVVLRSSQLGREAGVLSFHVDRTWSPLAAGISADGRQLGVAVSEIVWR